MTPFRRARRPPAEPADDPSATAKAETIARIVAEIRADGALGRTPANYRLLDFLARRSLIGRPPKEFEVALDVFQRDAGFDGAIDATIRVAVHRLRRSLARYHPKAAELQAYRLSIPLGAYALELTRAPSPPRVRRSPWALAAAAAATLLAVNAAAWIIWVNTDHDAYAAVRRAQPWAGLLTGARPLLVVTGDYYIFGETDPKSAAERLVRQYDINSPDDLANWLMDNPGGIGRYHDLDLFYLPRGTATALRYVMPILTPKGRGREQLRVIAASDLTPDMLERDDILYLGYFSGLRLLRDPVFGASRLRIGPTYDDLVDTRTGRRFYSEEGGRPALKAQQRDFGYFAALRGPTANRIVVIAGARDMGVEQVAEAVTSADGLREIGRRTNGAASFEALFEVDGIHRSSLSSRMILAAPMTPTQPWSPAQPRLVFPPG